MENKYFDYENKLPSGETEVLKCLEIDFENSKGENERVTFMVRPMINKWNYQKKISKAKSVTTDGDEFELAVNIAKELFEDCLVSHDFTNVNSKGWRMEEQISEFFINDPEVFTEVVGFLLITHSKKKNN